MNRGFGLFHLKPFFGWWLIVVLFLSVRQQSLYFEMLNFPSYRRQSRVCARLPLLDEMV